MVFLRAKAGSFGGRTGELRRGASWGFHTRGTGAAVTPGPHTTTHWHCACALASTHVEEGSRSGSGRRRRARGQPGGPRAQPAQSGSWGAGAGTAVQPYTWRGGGYAHA